MAIYQELDTSMYDGVAILENAAYMTQNINIARNIPVMETHSGYVAKFKDVSTFAEEYGISYLDALTSIAEVNDIIPEMMHVGIDEADIICDPTLINLFEDSSHDSRVVWVNPISENCLAYKYCSSLLEAYKETGDEDYLLAIIDEAQFGQGKLTEIMQKAAKDHADLMNGAHQKAYDAGDHKAERHLGPKAAAANDMEKSLNKQNINDIETKMKEYHAKQAEEQSKLGYKIKSKGRQALQFAKNNKGKLAVGAGLAAAAGGALAYKSYQNNQEMKQVAAIQKQMANAPRSWIAKKIASLRSLYSRYLQRARLAKASGQASVFQKVASKILSVIDALMKKMQNMTN